MALFVGALAVWLAVRVVPVLLLVFLAVLLAVFLSSVTDLLSRRLGIGRGFGLTLAALATSGAVIALGALFVPPVVQQTRALITGLPLTLASLQAALVRLGEQYPVFRDSALTDPQAGLVSGVLSAILSSSLVVLFPLGLLIAPLASIPLVHLVAVGRRAIVGWGWVVVVDGGQSRSF